MLIFVVDTLSAVDCRLGGGYTVAIILERV